MAAQGQAQAKSDDDIFGAGDPREEPGAALAVSNQKFGVAISTLAEAKEFAELIVESGLATKGDTVAAVLVKMQMGAEVGLAPMQAIQNIAVINGRPSLWGDAMLAVCMRHPDWGGIVEVFEDDGETAVCVVRRRGHVEYETRFGEAEAKAAGLIGKSGPWTQYKARMKQLRARGFALRDRFPDALRGLISREEAHDYPTGDPIIVTDYPAQMRAEQAPKIGHTPQSVTEDLEARARAEKAPTPEPAAKPQVPPLNSFSANLAQAISDGRKAIPQGLMARAYDAFALACTELPMNPTGVNDLYLKDGKTWGKEAGESELKLLGELKAAIFKAAKEQGYPQPEPKK